MYGKASWNIILQPVFDAYVYIFRMFRLKDWSWLEIKATTPLFGYTRPTICLITAKGTDEKNRENSSCF